jgi:hypothetical protein
MGTTHVKSGVVWAETGLLSPKNRQLPVYDPVPAQIVRCTHEFDGCPIAQVLMSIRFADHAPLGEDFCDGSDHAADQMWR